MRDRETAVVAAAAAAAAAAAVGGGKEEGAVAVMYTLMSPSLYTEASKTKTPPSSAVLMRGKERESEREKER